VQYKIKATSEMLVQEDVEIIKKVRAITAEGDNAEIKKGKDGKLKVLKVKKT